MKVILRTTVVLMLAVLTTACPGPKKSGAKFSDRGARGAGVTTAAQAGAVGPTALVTASDRSAWMSSVRRLVSSSIPENYLLDVSPDGQNNTGVFVGARLCMTPTYGTQQIPQKALVVVHVYDSYQVPVPIYLNAVGGTMSNGVVDAIFQDNYGQIRIYGQVVNQQYFQGTVLFNTRVKSDGSADNYGWETLGTFYMYTNDLFSCY